MMNNDDDDSKFRNYIITINKISIFEKLFYNSIKDGFIFIEDEESIKLKGMLKEKGVEATLREITENSIPDNLLATITI